MTTTPDDDAALLRDAILGFAETQGRRPRVMIAGLGPGPQGDAAKATATTYAALGFDVDLGPSLRNAAECARQAIENDVHAIGVSGDSSPAAAVAAQLRSQGADDIVVFAIADGADRLASAQHALDLIRKATST